MTGKVYLVGAGPGDPELITVKGLNILRQGDVIIYDRLIHPDLLLHAKKGAKLIYGGKAPSCHALKQETINELIIKFAKKGKKVVRLKGGDPFVFGRGGEEALACAKHGIPFEVVPGVTAGIGVPAYAGIPVTHRGISRSFALVTGHQADKEMDNRKWFHLANGVDTLCIYMGVSRLPHIVQSLLQAGKAQETPAALIHRGTCTNQKTVPGTLADIVDKAHEENITNPSMIVIGEVVELARELNWFQKEAAPSLSAVYG